MTAARAPLLTGRNILFQESLRLRFPDESSISASLCHPILPFTNHHFSPFSFGRSMFSLSYVRLRIILYRESFCLLPISASPILILPVSLQLSNDTAVRPQ